MSDDCCEDIDSVCRLSRTAMVHSLEDIIEDVGNMIFSFHKILI